MSGRLNGDFSAPVTSFVGRHDEIAEVRRCLSRSRLVTLTGVGGVGKTRLALEAAARSRKAFADGVWLADLSAVRDGALVTQTVATALGLQDRSTRPLPEQLVDFLADRQMLIVLDNCEHLLDSCAALVTQLLQAPDLRLLATSLQALRVAGERVLVVPPLPVPDPDHLPTLTALARYEAVSLLVDRVAAVQPGFSVTEENGPAIAKVCARLGGIPLAIELAAARVRTLPVGQVADQLNNRFTLLTRGEQTAPPRQQTLRGLIDWSYELCSAEERLLWARLSVFAGEFDLEAAEMICSDESLRREVILDLIDGLVAQSIIFRSVLTGRPRYRMLETIRQYGRERLADSDVLYGICRRHRDYYLRLAQRTAAQWCGPDQEAFMARLRADHDDLRSALAWCMTDPAGAEPMLAFTAALRFHWCTDEYLREGQQWLESQPGPVSILERGHLAPSPVGADDPVRAGHADTNPESASTRTTPPQLAGARYGT